jgi:MoaA/NifB/PqqE/SkfB family radical SAM enzyme
MCPWSEPEVRKVLTKNDPTMSIDLFKRVLEEVMPYCSFISLTSNGEFLMDPFLKERLSIVGEVLQRHPDVRLFCITNASLLSAEKLSYLKGLHKAGFTISIESVDALTYASIRRPGVLSQVMKNIKSLRHNLSKIGIDDVQLQINAVIMKSTIFSVPGLLHLAKEINAILFVDHCQGYGNTELNRESLFIPAFTNKFLDKCQN